MGRPLVLPPDFHGHNFLLLRKKETHPRNRIRLLAMHHLQQQKTLSEVGDIVGHSWRTVQGWLRRFRASGFEGLFESPRSGAPQKVTGKAEKWLQDTLIKLSESKTGGYITGVELQTLLEEKHNIKCSLKTIYNTLHRLKFSWISCRSMHPKSKLAVQEAYKKNSRIC